MYAARLMGCRPVYAVCIYRKRPIEKKLVTDWHERGYEAMREEAGTSYTERRSLCFPSYTDCIIIVSCTGDLP